MKAYLVTTLVIDFDGLGSDGIVTEMENVRYPNRCLAPSVQEITEFDIGEWDDSHPLNKRGTNVTDYLTSTLMPKD